eukprot:scaffold91_cov56-Phaeocystis_antarctica.AAC.2
MVVTLDVSRLSGWLNDDAPCRVGRKTYSAGRGASREVGGRGVAVVHAACTQPPTASRGEVAREGEARARRREGGEAATAAQTVCREGPAGG